MNTGMTVIYEGNLRTRAEHLKSGNTLITDAPVDNHGKGEAFSPTDLLCTSLASCMITLMGITAEAKGIKLGNVKANIEKVMYSEPRRVGEIHVALNVQDMMYSPKDKSILENAALSCPVAKSIHPEIKQVISFVYSA
jgi:uncharacterized OsmC-like protein